MGLRIATNMQTMAANRELSSVTGDRVRTLERLSSGNRIVRSGDDAAGLSISEKLRSGIRSMQMAKRNTQDGISLIQTAEGGIVEAQNMLIRLRELSMAAASDNIGNAERAFTNQEFQQLKEEIGRVANTTLYNRAPLLNGTATSFDFQVGIEHGSSERITYSTKLSNITPAALGISSLASDTKENARNNLSVIDSAISQLNENRAYLGGMQTQLGHHMMNLDVHRTNLAEGNSRLRDADMAEWTAKAASQKIQQDAGNAVLVQAQAIPKAALRLLDDTRQALAG